jgi:CTP:molybdopterin cytidylyltransferase MocA
MFAADLQQEFFLHGDTNGAKEVLMRHRGETARISLHDPDICFDVDTPEDLHIVTDAGARWARVEKDVEERKKARFR